MKRYRGSCHCGAVAFEIETELDSVLMCDCSLCKRKNIVMHSLPQEQFRLLKGEKALSLYRWNTGIAKHYFCKHCGIYTHHHRRRQPELLCVNVNCIDGLDWSSLPMQRVEGSKLSGGPGAVSA